MSKYVLNQYTGLPDDLGDSTLPGGSTTQVQYNDAGTFGGSANFQFDETGGFGGGSQLTLAETSLVLSHPSAGSTAALFYDTGMVRSKSGTFVKRIAPPTKEELRAMQDRINERQRKWRANNPRKEELKRHRKIVTHLYRAKNKDKFAQYEKTKAEKLQQSPELRKKRQEARKMYQLNHPDKKKAQIKASNWIRLGKIKKYACVICGEKKAHGHHNDYSKPLELTWLCQEHHQAWHRVFIAESVNG